MSTVAEYRKHLPWCILLAILLLAFALRVYNLDYYSIWEDEASTVDIAAMGPRGILDSLLLYHHAAPPLHYFIVYVFTSVGKNALLARWPSLAFGVLGVAMMYRLGRLMFGDREALLGALLLSVSGLHVFYSQEARMYAQFAFFTSLSLYFFWRAVNTNSGRDWTCYSLVTLLSLYTHYYTVFLICAEGIYLVAWLLARYAQHRSVDRHARQAFWGLVISLLGISLLFSPWVPTMLAARSSATAPTPVIDSWFFQDIFEGLSAGTMLSAALFISLYLLGCFSSWRRAGGLLAATTLIPLGCMALFHVRVQSFFALRYVTFLLPPFLLLVARGLTALGQRSKARQALSVLTCACLVALALVALCRYYPTARFADAYGHGAQDWKGVVAFIEQQARPYDTVAFYRAYMYYCYDFYEQRGLERYGFRPGEPGVGDDPKSGLRTYSYHLVNFDPFADQAPKLFDDVFRRIIGPGRVWMIFTRAHPIEGRTLLRGHLDEHYRQVLYREFQGDIEVLLYELKGG